MKKWNLIIDVSKCSNCNNCTMAVKDEYIGNDFSDYSAAQPKLGHEWITIDRHVRGNDSMVDVTYVPRTCNHCDDAPCVSAGGDAVTKREDGIVIINPVKARGRKDLVSACPYGAVWWNEELQIPQHWTFDAHLLDGGWKQPRCVQACATGAMSVAHVTDEEMHALTEQQGLTALKPELKTRPRVHYRGLERVTAGFIGGNVYARNAAGLLDNVEGVSVELSLESEAEPRQMLTDAYGDFKFEGIRGDHVQYTIRIRDSEHGGIRLTGIFETSVYHRPIELGR